MEIKITPGDIFKYIDAETLMLAFDKLLQKADSNQLIIMREKIRVAIIDLGPEPSSRQIDD